MRVSRHGHCSSAQRMRMLRPGSHSTSYSRSIVGGVHRETANIQISSSSLVVPTLRGCLSVTAALHACRRPSTWPRPLTALAGGHGPASHIRLRPDTFVMRRTCEISIAHAERTHLSYHTHHMHLVCMRYRLMHPPGCGLLHRLPSTGWAAMLQSTALVLTLQQPLSQLCRPMWTPCERLSLVLNGP